MQLFVAWILVNHLLANKTSTNQGRVKARIVPRYEVEWGPRRLKTVIGSPTHISGPSGTPFIEKARKSSRVHTYSMPREEKRERTTLLGKGNGRMILSSRIYCSESTRFTERSLWGEVDSSILPSYTLPPQGLMAHPLLEYHKPRAA